MRKILFIAVLAAWLSPSVALAQTCNPKAVFSYTKDGEAIEEERSEYSGEAPVTGRFSANPEDYAGYQPVYEWWIYPSSGTKEQFVVHRSGVNEAEFEYTFSQSGSFIVALKVTFSKDNDSVDYPEVGEHTFSVTVSESKLEMPNAFSPNGDGKNDEYKAKSTHQSIVEFRATIFNRWGQKLYQWNDVNGGWDGKYKGKTVKDGVYFVNVVAKGADGVEYKIRKDVNVLTRYNEEEGNE